MGWIVCIAMLLIGCFNANDILVVTSGLFAISGAISEVASSIKDTRK